VFAAATHFRITIRGRGGHAASPHETVDPIVVAAHAIVALQTVVSRSVDPSETAVFSIGRVQGGVRGNVIPNECWMSGTIRTYEARVLARMLARIGTGARVFDAVLADGAGVDDGCVPDPGVRLEPDVVFNERAPAR
jgi:metal-dependent amidase/aminoacylase/carboxypeptidase family protein